MDLSSFVSFRETFVFFVVKTIQPRSSLSPHKGTRLLCVICTKIVFYSNMYTRTWHVIKDETTKTFEVITQASNDNAFSNKTYAMQKAGMNINAIILPVTNKNANKESIKLVGYSYEDGLYERLLKEHQKITLKNSGFWDD